MHPMKPSMVVSCCHYCCCILSDGFVTVGFDADAIDVVENSLPFEVCFSILGDFERDIAVTVTTEVAAVNDSAEGIYALL